MNKKQIIAIITPPVLIAFMYPIFNSLAGALDNDRIAWYLGLITYWLIWGMVFPLIIIGRKDIKALVRPQKPNVKAFLFVAIPMIFTLIGRFAFGMIYESENLWILLLLISTAIGNGFFEEVLWRGVYAQLFPEKIFHRIIWPSLWFALWHYVPGSIFGDNMASLMIGAGIFGLYLSYMTKKTNTIWWAIITHFLCGIIQVF